MLLREVLVEAKSPKVSTRFKRERSILDENRRTFAREWNETYAKISKRGLISYAKTSRKEKGRE